jgi:hypothetical protein
MPTRASKQVREAENINSTAFRIMQQATGQSASPKPGKEKNPAAVALGKLGASKGGVARAKSLSKKERSKIAKNAAASRWKHKNH